MSSTIPFKINEIRIVGCQKECCLCKVCVNYCWKNCLWVVFNLPLINWWLVFGTFAFSLYNTAPNQSIYRELQHSSIRLLYWWYNVFILVIDVDPKWSEPHPLLNNGKPHEMTYCDEKTCTPPTYLYNLVNNGNPFQQIHAENRLYMLEI